MLPIILKKENADILKLYRDKQAKEVELIQALTDEQKEAIRGEIAAIETSITELEAIVAKQIADWKIKYGTVHEIGVADKKVYLKKLERNSLSLALTYMGREPIKFAETIFENNAIGGDTDMIDDTDYLPGLTNECIEIVNGVRTLYVKH